MLAKQSRNNQFIRPALKWKEARKVEAFYRPEITEALNDQIVESGLRKIINEAIIFWEKIKKEDTEEERLQSYVGSLLNEYKPIQDDSVQSKRLKKVLTALWITVIELGIIRDKNIVRDQLIAIGSDRLSGVISQMSFDVDLTNGAVLDFIDHRMGVTLTGLNATQQIRIKNFITNGVARGLDASEIVANISVLQGINERRAWTIVRSEIGQARSYENEYYLRERGFTLWTWVCNQPVDICLMNCGVTRKIGDPFPSGDTSPLVHPNCQCDTVGHVPAGRDLISFITLIIAGRDWSGE